MKRFFAIMFACLLCGSQALAQTIVVNPTLPQFGINRGTGQICHKLIGGQCFLLGTQNQTTGQFTLPFANLPALSANTLLGNASGSSSAASAISIPSCSGSTNGLTWTSGVGFGCNTISGSVGSGTTGQVCAYASSGASCSGADVTSLITKPLGGAVIYATSYGVVADGTTDNTTALRAAAAACGNVNSISGYSGGQLILPAGVIVINGTITFNTACSVEGVGSGGGLSASDYGATVIQQNSITSDTLAFTTLNGVQLRNFAINYGNGQQGSGNAILIQPTVPPYGGNPNRFSVVENVRVWGGGTGINCPLCANYAFRHNFVFNYSNYGIYVSRSSSDPDSGDAIIDGNVLWDFNVTSGTAAIRLDPSAAVAIVGNKTLNGQIGLWLSVSQGPTGTMNVGDNSFEEYTSVGIRITQVYPKTYAAISIHDNEFLTSSSTAQSGISVERSPGGSGAYIDRMLIHDNNIAAYGSTYAPASCMNIQDGNYVNIHNNACNMLNTSGSVGYIVGGNASNVKFIYNQWENVGTSYNLAAGVEIVN